MKYTVKHHPKAKIEISRLEKSYFKKLLKDYEKIEDYGIDYVWVEPLQEDLYEIKTGKIRSLFTYKEGQLVIVLLVFLKKTQKTPKKHIKQALTRLEEIK